MYHLTMCYMIWCGKGTWEMYSLLGPLGDNLILTNCLQFLLSFAIYLLVTHNRFYLLLMEQQKQRKWNTWPGIIRRAIIIIIPQIPVLGSAKQTRVSMRFNSESTLEISGTILKQSKYILYFLYCTKSELKQSRKYKTV